jgi:hypothetical protein
MARLLTLTASAAAASERLADGLADGQASASDGFQGFYAFALRQARPAQPLPRSVLAVLAQAAAARAKIALAPSDCVAFAGVLSELHASGATPADVEAAGRGTLLERRARALGRAFAAHRELLEACGKIDPGALAEAAGRGLALGRAAGRTPLEFDLVHVEPRAAWTQGELSLVAALGAVGLRVSVALPYDPKRAELFAPLDKAHQELHRGGRVESSNVDPADGASPALRERLRRLFDLASDAAVVGEAGPSPVQAFTLPTAEAEARELARRVRALLRAGCSPDRIAVAGREDALLAAARTLRSAGIPASRPAARTLAGTLPGRAALGLLELADRGIEREPLCRMLAAGLWPLGGPPGQRKRGVELAELLREAGSLDHASGTLLPPLRAHLERQGGALSGGDRRPVDRLELVRELDRALGVVEALPSRGRVGSHAAALWAALRQLGTTQALVSSPPEPLVGAGSGEERSRSRVASAETALALERLGEVLSELAGLRDVSGVRGAGWPSLSRGEFAGLLGAALAGEPAPAGRDVAAGVALCDPGALVGRRFDHVFLLGLVDREAEGDGEALLPAALREAICRRLERPAALRASGRVAQRKQERLGLYLACCSARLTLSASAPRMDVGGSPIEPAALLRELARVAGREEPERLERPLLPVGELCLTRGEAIAAHWQDPALRSAEPGPVAQVAQLAERERRRREAIIAGRADPASGALAGGSEGAAELLARLVARLERKPLSPSLLELMAGCGFRALCDRILDLGPPEERGEELAANEGGTVRHACLKAAFEALGREGLLPLEGGTRRRRELQTFLGGANAALDAYEREAPVGHPTVWAAERRTIVRQLVGSMGES